LPDKDNQRFVVTTLCGPSPARSTSRTIAQRGQAENLIKQVKCDLTSGRALTSTFLANLVRLLLTAGAYVLHQQLCQLGLQGTSLASGQPKTVIPLTVQDCRTCQTIHSTGCCCICPVPARPRRCWRRFVSGFIHQAAGCAPYGLPHDPARSAHETVPPTLINNGFTLHPASGVEDFRLKIEKITSWQ